MSVSPIYLICFDYDYSKEVETALYNPYRQL